MRWTVGLWACVVVSVAGLARGRGVAGKDPQAPQENDEPIKAAKSLDEAPLATNVTSNYAKTGESKDDIHKSQVKLESPVIVDAGIETEVESTTTTTESDTTTETPTTETTIMPTQTTHADTESSSSSEEGEDETTETSETTHDPNSAETTTKNGHSDERSGESGQVRPSAEEVNVENIVETEHGPVRGHKHGKSETILSYLDIPYGKFVSLFADPQEPDPWEEIHKVTEHSKRCPQIQYPSTYVGETDCLTLSVFAPVNAEKADVLFHIYDSNFVSGSADPAIYGPEYLVEKGIILVLPNYRLGPLGFLCLRNEIVPGNAALKDLMLALDWTKRNIAEFGGNAFNIVVSGEGSSGALAEYLALSPYSNSHIAKIITESGSALAHWAIDRRPTEKTEALLKRLNADSDDTLKNIEVEKVVIASINITFRPCIEVGDGAFINETAWTMITENEFNMPLMLGSAVYAGMHETLAHKAITLEDINEDSKLLLPNDLVFKNTKEQETVAARVKEQYFGDNSVGADEMEKLVLWRTDMSYLGPGLRAARAWAAAGASVHFYEFLYLGELNREHSTLTNPLDGAVRGDTVGYIFCQDQTLPEPSSHEEQMVDVMTDLWVSFIRTGKPSADDVEWTELNATDDSGEHWLAIDRTLTSQSGVHAARLRLWTDVYRQHFADGNGAPARGSVATLLLLPLPLLWIYCNNEYLSF